MRRGGMVIFIACLVFLGGTMKTSAAQTVGPQACGMGGETSTSCSANNVNILGSLEACMDDALPACDQTLVTVDAVPKCTYTYDGEDYNKARGSSYGNMFPLAVIYVESEEEAVKALKCAVDNGYRVTARGRGHDYQGLSTMHGNVIIDMSLTCKPDEFVIDRTGGDHILPGQRYLATIQVQPGCTNAVLLAAAHNNFNDEEGALALIGSCPSVGITGFLLGGGSGDVAPYSGWMVDLLEEARVILYNGTVVTASREENPDLFWALRGGGSGNGIVSSLTLRIVQAPDPPEGKERKFTMLKMFFDNSDAEKRPKVLQTVQDFFYDVDPSVSSKFGGTASFTRDSLNLGGVYLGSFEEFVSEMSSETGLLNPDLYCPDLTCMTQFPGNTTLFRTNNEGNLEPLCGDERLGVTPCQIPNLPAIGITAWEFDSYPKLAAYRLCQDSLTEYNTMVTSALFVRSTNDWCADLGIESKYCSTRPLNEFITNGQNGFLQFIAAIGLLDVDPSDTYSFPVCNLNAGVFTEAILKNAGDPESFLNRHGPSPYWLLNATIVPPLATKYSPSGTSLGSVLLPKLELDTLETLSLSERGLAVNHLQHGAPMMVPVYQSALPWGSRNAAMMVEFPSGLGEFSQQKAEFLDILVKDKKYDGDTFNLSAYYNYLGPYTPNWRTLYFGDHYEMLQQIRCANDPVDVFGKPLTVELCQEGYATKNLDEMLLLSAE